MKYKSYSFTEKNKTNCNIKIPFYIKMQLNMLLLYLFENIRAVIDT